MYAVTSSQSLGLREGAQNPPSLHHAAGPGGFPGLSLPRGFRAIRSHPRSPPLPESPHAASSAAGSHLSQLRHRHLDTVAKTLVLAPGALSDPLGPPAHQAQRGCPNTCGSSSFEDQDSASQLAVLSGGTSAGRELALHCNILRHPPGNGSTNGLVPARRRVIGISRFEFLIAFTIKLIEKPVLPVFQFLTTVFLKHSLLATQ